MGSAASATAWRPGSPVGADGRFLADRRPEFVSVVSPGNTSVPGSVTRAHASGTFGSRSPWYDACISGRVARPARSRPPHLSRNDPLASEPT